jgi:hypothetical protein
VGEVDGDEDGENVGNWDGEEVRSIVRSSMCDESVRMRDDGFWSSFSATEKLLARVGAA